MEWRGMDLVRDMDSCRSLETAVVNLGVPQNAENVLFG